MFLLVKEIDGEQIIIGTAQKQVSPSDDIVIYEIPDDEYSSDMIYSKIDSFDEDNEIE